MLKSKRNFVQNSPKVEVLMSFNVTENLVVGIRKICFSHDGSLTSYLLFQDRIKILYFHYCEQREAKWSELAAEGFFFKFIWEIKKTQYLGYRFFDTSYRTENVNFRP